MRKFASKVESAISKLVNKHLVQASKQYARDQQFWRDIFNEDPATKPHQRPTRSLPDDFVEDTVRDYSLEFTFRNTADFDEQDTGIYDWTRARLAGV